MRLIDADLAIEELTDRSHQAAKRVGIDSPFWEGLVIARRIVKNIPTIQPEPQWIPCSKRMPEEKDAGILKKLGTEKKSEYVLATVEVKGERMTVTACTYDGKWDWNMKYAFPDFKVIAWIPLPKPYEGEGEQE